MKAHWIWLTGLSGFGPVGQKTLLEQFGSAEALYAADENDLRRAGLTDEAVRVLLCRDLSTAERILRACEQKGIRVLTLRDEAYPAPLRTVEDAPAVLYLRGALPPLGRVPAVGLVGSRDADERGLLLARQLGWQIAGCGGVTVTGMARGVDAWAARGALDAGGAVIGVLGCGVDVVYPRQEAELFARVTERGCLISEYPPGTAPNARHFPARNRIISALSDGVAVIQARERSGALITARWAADQGRDVFAVPGPAGDERSRGCNQLLKDGAILAECGWDIMCEYEYRYPGFVREYHGRPPAASPAPVPEAGKRAARRAGKEPAGEAGKGSLRPGDPPAADRSPPEAKLPELSALTPVQRTVVETLREGPLQLDALIDRTGLSAAEILPQLTLLQIRKIIVCHPGKRYSIQEP